jgi:hypothetical protein
MWGSAGDDSTASLTKAEFIEKADALCGATVKQIETESAPT